MKTPHELRREAEQFRRLATDIDDRWTMEALRELADDYEGLALVLERQELVRKRAYEMWEQQGRPHGRHADHWVAAERELADAEKVA
jgi:hypothetical protein